MNFLGILALIFITLKLLGYIIWSWWLVLLPIYPMIILFGLGFTWVVTLISASVIDYSKGKKK